MPSIGLAISNIGFRIREFQDTPQIGLLYGIKSKAAISVTLDLHCKTIAALYYIPCQVVLFEDTAVKTNSIPVTSDLMVSSRSRGRDAGMATGNGVSYLDLPPILFTERTKHKYYGILLLLKLTCRMNQMIL